MIRCYFRGILIEGVTLTSPEFHEPVLLAKTGLKILACTFPEQTSCYVYFRRDKLENTNVTWKKVEGEYIFSDVFHIRIETMSEYSSCSLLLPLYINPVSKEDMVLRYFDCELEDKDVEDFVVEDGVSQ